MNYQEQTKILQDFMRNLGITPKRQSSIKLPILSPEELRNLKNKGFSRDMRNYFKYKKDISVYEVGEKLVDLLDYAIDIKDSNTIARVSRDLSVFYKIVKLLDKGKK